MEDDKTTISVNRSLIAKIDKLKVHERQPYEEVIEALVNEALKNKK